MHNFVIDLSKINNGLSDRYSSPAEALPAVQAGLAKAGFTHRSFSIGEVLISAVSMPVEAVFFFMGSFSTFISFTDSQPVTRHRLPAHSRSGKGRRGRNDRSNLY